MNHALPIRLTGIALLALTLAIATTTHEAHAGYSIPPDFGCQKQSAGQGTCMGTINDFLNSSNPNDYAELLTVAQVGTPTSYQFYARYAGNYYSCGVEAGTTLDPALLTTLTSRTVWFEIGWDPNGNCNYLFLENTSVTQ
jgi:hypothetical protein